MQHSIVTTVVTFCIISLWLIYLTTGSLYLLTPSTILLAPYFCFATFYHELSFAGMSWLFLWLGVKVYFSRKDLLLFLPGLLTVGNKLSASEVLIQLRQCNWPQNTRMSLWLYENVFPTSSSLRLEMSKCLYYLRIFWFVFIIHSFLALFENVPIRLPRFCLVPSQVLGLQRGSFRSQEATLHLYFSCC